MKSRPKINRPPYPGEYAWGGIHEAISEEEKAGRPLAPVVELLSPRLSDEHEAEPAPPADPPESPPQPE